jgi:hypothetical protein
VIRGLVIGNFQSHGLDLSATTTVQGNFIGTDPSGTLDRGNGGIGIIVEDSSGQSPIGGASPAARNLISGNAGQGIYTNRPVTVQNNFIGTQRDGVSPLGNGLSGLHLETGDNLVGGGDAGNVIAFNGGDGIELVNDNMGSLFSRNRIFSNEALGIDLNDDGVTPNDSLDADVGPNELQNFPVLGSAVTAGGTTTVNGHLSSTPSQQFTLEFFSNPPGGDEGKTFIGSLDVSTDAGGQTPFTFHPANPVAAGNTITATATNSNQSTSEFSARRKVKTQ